MKKSQNKVAAITGAGSGIGRALALQMAAEGYRLAISDIKQEWLMETARLIGSNSVNVTTHIVDVANREQVYSYADEVVQKHGGVDIIVNNAGVVVASSIEHVSYEDFEWLMGINFWGVVYGTKAFLPYLKKRTEGRIVNISSINGIIPSPFQVPYNVAKYAVKGFTETLIQELTGTTVHATVVHPGGIKTGIARNGRFRGHINANKCEEQSIQVFEEKVFRMTSEKAAQIILAGVKKKKTRILVGSDAKVLDLMTRIAPVFAVNYLTNLAKKYFE